jgi:hypothetical protein
MMSWQVVRTACADCGIGTITAGEYYMVHDDVWEQAWAEREGLASPSPSGILGHSMVISIGLMPSGGYSKKDGRPTARGARGNRSSGSTSR